MWRRATMGVQGGMPRRSKARRSVIVNQVRYVASRRLRQGEELIVRRVEHLSGQQANRRADALAARGEQMHQRGTQVRMRIIGCACRSVSTS